MDGVVGGGDMKSIFPVKSASKDVRARRRRFLCFCLFKKSELLLFFIISCRGDYRHLSGGATLHTCERESAFYSV